MGILPFVIYSLGFEHMAAVANEGSVSTVRSAEGKL